MSEVKQAPLSWLTEAFKYEGLREIKGAKHNSTIVGWLKSLRAWWSEDETPWCGTFVAHCLTVGGRAVPKNWFRALAYKEYGSVLTKPAYGCIAMTQRKGGGHVFFVVGETENGDIVGYGGNQSDMVNLRVFPRNAIVGYRWPAQANGVLSMPYKERYDLPKYKSTSISKVTNMA